MVGEHHSPRTDPDPLRCGGDLSDHQLRRGACDHRTAMVLGKPVAVIAQSLGVLGQLDRIAQSLRFGRAGSDRRKVEY